MGFDEAVDIIFRHEGYYSNDLSDSGGETKYGISAKAYPKLNIATLTKDDAKAIYKRDYWNKIRADELPDQLRLTVFDFAVNAGVKKAIKTLQLAGGVDDDGKLGGDTLAASKKVSVWKYSEYRIRHYTGVVQARPTNIKYLAGWNIRTLNIIKESLA